MFLNELRQRFNKSKTPIFFKKITLLLVSMGGSLTVACSTALSSYGEQLLPAMKFTLQVFLGIGISCAILGYVIPKLAVDWNRTDPKEIPDVEVPQNLKKKL